MIIDDDPSPSETFQNMVDDLGYQVAGMSFRNVYNARDNRYILLDIAACRTLLEQIQQFILEMDEDLDED